MFSRPEVRWAAATAALLAVCSGCIQPPSTKPYRLPSGRELETFFAGPIEDEWHLAYRTRLPLSHELTFGHMDASVPIPSDLQAAHRALQCEANTLRDDVQKEAEAAGVLKAVIAPTSTAQEFVAFEGWKPVISVGRALEFDVEKDDQGTWKATTGWRAYQCDL